MSQKSHKTTTDSSTVPTFNRVLLASLIASTVGLAAPANAFVVENANQKTILIGKAGEPLQPITVKELPAPPPTSTVQVTQQPAYNQNTYNPNFNTQTSNQEYIPYDQYQQTQNQQAYQQYQQIPQYQPPATTYTPPTTGNYGNAFERLAITTNSSAVLVYDLLTGQPLYEKNINAVRSIASVSKMMTAMVIMDSGLNMEEVLTISHNDLSGAKVASTRLAAGDRLTRKEWMLLMLMKSENPAAKVLATTYPGGFDAFISAMNAKAQSLGMYNTRFADSSGLNPRNVSTAQDLGKMMKEIATNPNYRTIQNFSAAKSYNFYIENFTRGNRMYSAANTSQVVRAGKHLLGSSKTGFIREAGYCVVMNTQVGSRPAVVVLLGAGSSNARWNDANRILEQLAFR